MPFLTSPIPLSILLGCAVLVWIAGWFGKTFWLLDLFSHFQLHFLAGTIFVALYALTRREKSTVIAGFIFAACILAVMLILTPFRLNNMECRKNLKITSFNVYTPNTRMNDVANFLQTEKPDIIALYEINNIWAFALKPLLKDYPYHLIQPSSDNFGIALLSRQPLVNARVLSTGSYDVPMITAQLGNAPDSPLIIAVHTLPPASKAASDDRGATLKAIEQTMGKNPGRPIIVMGDLNATLWSYPLRDIVRHTGLQPARLQSWTGTWHTAFYGLGIPIDHILQRGYACARAQTGPDLGSDHHPLTAVLGFR